jgi:hypothetical protein
MGRSRLALLALSLSVLAPSQAVADSIGLTGGTLVMGMTDPAPFGDIHGVLNGPDLTLSLQFLADSFQCTSHICNSLVHPGISADLSGVITLVGVPGLEYQGVSYIRSGTLTITVPMTTVEPGVVVLPFTLAGTIHGQDAHGGVVDLDLTGQGTLTALFVTIGSSGELLELWSEQYNVTPTPEPSTWLLVVSGAIGAAALCRRTRLLARSARPAASIGKA